MRHRIQNQRPEQERQLKDPESKVYGRHACWAVFKRRPQDIIRAYVRRDLVNDCGPILKYCASHKKAYHLVEDNDLERLTESHHHGGICLLTREAPEKKFPTLFAEIKKQDKPCCLILLDGVDNPHNIGNIMRAAAHFGMPAILTLDPQLKKVPGATRRVSQGGSESVPLVRLLQPLRDLAELKKIGFKIWTTSSHHQKSLFHGKIPEKIIFVLGSEESGISSRLEKLADAQVCIPGTGEVESLNVASACAILMAEFQRCRERS